LIELVEYLDDRGRSPFATWRRGLDDVSRARIDKAAIKLGEGNLSAIKGVGSGVLEMRLDFGPGFRIYLARDGDRIIILLGGGTKRRQQADIEVAKDRWRDYRKRKQAQ
jgi:putative addiction module killer protein